jgi:hypothetical protein
LIYVNGIHFSKTASFFPPDSFIREAINGVIICYCGIIASPIGTIGAAGSRASIMGLWTVIVHISLCPGIGAHRPSEANKYRYKEEFKSQTPTPRSHGLLPFTNQYFHTYQNLIEVTNSANHFIGSLNLRFAED